MMCCHSERDGVELLEGHRLCIELAASNCRLKEQQKWRTDDFKCAEAEGMRFLFSHGFCLAVKMLM